MHTGHFIFLFLHSSIRSSIHSFIHSFIRFAVMVRWCENRSAYEERLWSDSAGCGRSFSIYIYPSMCPSLVVLTRPSLPQHMDLLPLVELAAMCSPGLEFHFTAPGIFGENEITSMLGSLQHPLSWAHAVFPGELAHPLPMLATCVKLGAVGESMQSLKEGCTRGRGKKRLWARGGSAQAGKGGGRWSWQLLEARAQGWVGADWLTQTFSV